MGWVATWCRNCIIKCDCSCKLFNKRFYGKKSLHDLLLSMPRDTTHTEVLKTQRVKIKQKSLKYSPGTVNLQVLGSGAKGAPTSLYLFTDQSRYLFNCGEGAQRLAHEHKIKLSKLEHIFITYPSWKNIGGLPGVALTLQDVGVPQIILHGPSVVEQIFPATRRFVVLKNMSIRTASCTPQDEFEDTAIKVRYIPLVAVREQRPNTASGTPRSEEDETDYYEHERGSPNRRKTRRRSSSEEPSPKKVPEEDVSMCYAVKLHPKPGALCLEKCVEAGVPPGPLLGRLKAGEDIVLDSGTIVRSADVTRATDPGPTFLVVEVPDEKFLPRLEDSFKRYQTPESEDELPYLIVHFSPPHIMAHHLYRKWMEGFNISTRHLVMNTSNSCLGSTAVHRIQHKLHLIEANIFPLLNDPGFPLGENEKLKENIPNGITKKNDLDSNFIMMNGNTRTKIGLRPRKDDDSESLNIDPDCYRREAESIDGFHDELAKLKTQLNMFPVTEKKYPNIVFLGTGSCIPNKTRNTSAILLNISKDCRIMMDCGEGTAGQVVRHYGLKGAAEVFSSLRAVYVSHLHADHHIGLVGLLKSLPPDAPPLYLLAPGQIMTWLRLYDEYFESILNSFILLPNSDLRYDEYHLRADLKEGLQSALNMEKIETTFVRHCPNAFGVSFTSKDGWKITYSGDTMPSESLVELGVGSDLLIHEATMEDELVGEARAKMHSTTSEAIEIGKKMQANHVILTHFSQRYAKLPRIVGDNLGENIGVAFDNMKVLFDDLPKLKHLYPVLKLIFKEDIEELEDKAYKRQLKKERAAIR